MKFISDNVSFTLICDPIEENDVFKLTDLKTFVFYKSKQKFSDDMFRFKNVYNAVKIIISMI